MRTSPRGIQSPGYESWKGTDPQGRDIIDGCAWSSMGGR